MKYLLDTHILLWVAIVPEKLSSEVLNLVENPDNELIFSAASIWEISIKSQMGRDDFKVDAGVFRRSLIDNGYIELPIRSEHAAETYHLPILHKDPFDRMLIAQSFYEGITLLTSDKLVCQYSNSIVYASKS